MSDTQVPGEAKPKQIVLLTVNEGQFKTDFIPLSQVRPFGFEEITLSEVLTYASSDTRLVASTRVRFS